jgi:hypothetical protein
MKEYNLKHTPLNGEPVKVLRFTSSRKRESFVFDLVCGCKGERVFSLIIDRGEINHQTIFVFKYAFEIEKIVKTGFKNVEILEFKTFTQAYKHANNLRKTNK